MLSRPRLRTKTGCLTCRRRRKKCTEEKPRCRDCTRHGLECKWQESPSINSFTLTAASSPTSCWPVSTPLSRASHGSSSILQSANGSMTARLSPSGSLSDVLRAVSANPLTASRGQVQVLATDPPHPAMSLAVSAKNVTSKSTAQTSEEVQSIETAPASSWPLSISSLRNGPLTRNAVATPPFRLLPALQVRPLASRSDAENNLFKHFTGRFMPLLVRSSAHPNYLDTSNVFISTAHRPWMLDIYCGLASLHISQGRIEKQAEADRYYNSALRAYWRTIESGEAKGTEDWLLSAAIFFYLYEQWRSTISSNIMQHLEGTAHILRLRRTLRGNSPIKAEFPSKLPSSALDRIAAESFIYNIASVSLFHEDLDCVSSKFSWDDIEEGLRYDPFPNASQDENSPVTGASPAIYRMAFEVARLSRHAPLHKYDLLEAWHFQRELNILKATYSMSPTWSPEDAFPPDLNDFVWPSDVFNMDDPVEKAHQTLAEPSTAVRLYVLAIEIYLLKLISNDITSTHPYIQHLVRQAIHLLRAKFSNRYGVRCSTYFCWPIAILACAIESAADMMLLKERLVELWTASFCGYVRRIALLVQRVWKWRSAQLFQQMCVQSAVNSDAEYIAGPCELKDGLSLLTKKEGVFAFLEAS